MVYSNTAVYGVNVYIVYFHFFEALDDVFEVQFFSGLHFTPYQRRREHVRDIKSENIVKTMPLRNESPVYIFAG